MRRSIRRLGGLLLAIALICMLIPAGVVRAGNSERYTVIVLENSRSISYHSGGKTIYTRPETLSSSKKAAQKFVDSLKEQGVNEYIAVVYYDANGAYIATDFTTDIDYVKQAINDISVLSDDKGINMASGLAMAESLLLYVNNSNRNVVVINTGDNDSTGGDYSYDGHYDSTVEGSEWEWGETEVKEYAYANVAYDAAASLKNYATVYSIGVFDLYDDMPSAGREIVALQRLLASDIASDTKHYYEATNVDQISDQMDEVFKQYNQKVYKVTPVVNDAAFGSVTGGGSVLEGDNVTVYATPADDCEFLGWYDGSKLVSTNVTYSFSPGATTTLTAKFRKKQIPVSATVNNSVYGTVSCPGTIGIGETVTYKAQPGIGYKFDGWYRNGALVSSLNPYSFVATADNTNLQAVFSWDKSMDDDTLAKQAESSELPKLLLEGHANKNQNQIDLKWTNAGKNVYYEVYQSVCDGKANFIKVGTTQKNNFTIKNLNKKRAYKFFVAAYKKSGNDKSYIAKAISAHIALPGYAQTNVKSMSLKSPSVTIKKGKTATIKATVTGENPKKKIVAHVAAFRYETSDPTIATVNKKGVVKGKKKGSCTIYVIANNGVHKSVKVQVK